MRTSWSVALVALLLAFVAVGCSRNVAPLARGPAATARVALGVRVGTADIGGMTVADAEKVLNGLAAQMARAPRNAHVDPYTKGLVPSVTGVRLDLAAILRQALAARRGQEVTPITEPLPPAINVSDLPPAPIYNGPQDRPEVAFVINVAWGEQYLPGMLRTVAADKAPVTFCLVGRWAEAHPDLVREMVETGQRAGAPHTFCNHGYRDHGWALLSQAQALDSITAGDRAIARLTGATPRYFSPHRGEFNPGVLAASRQAGHELVLWSLDTIDWKNPPASMMRTRIVSKVKAGDIVLMHPTAPTEEALAAMIAGVRAKGLRLVTLDGLLSPEGGA